MNTLKLLKTYPTDFEAEIVKNKLEREGIEAVIEAEDASQMLPSLDYASGYRVYVEPEDYSKAFELVDNPENAITDDMEIGEQD
jgi:hypothetical protein